MRYACGESQAKPLFNTAEKNEILNIPRYIQCGI